MSFRDVEDMMAARGVVLTYETVRVCRRPQGRRPRTGDRGYLDEVFIHGRPDDNLT